MRMGETVATITQGSHLIMTNTQVSTNEHLSGKGVSFGGSSCGTFFSGVTYPTDNGLSVFCVEPTIDTDGSGEPL